MDSIKRKSHNQRLRGGLFEGSGAKGPGLNIPALFDWEREMDAKTKAMRNRIARVQGQLKALNELLGDGVPLGKLYELALAINGAANGIVLEILRGLLRGAGPK